jgi:hypothetical protein
MWRRVDILLTDVLEERIASIFRVEYKKKSASEPAWTGATDKSYILLWKSEASVRICGMHIFLPVCPDLRNMNAK